MPLNFKVPKFEERNVFIFIIDVLSQIHADKQTYFVSFRCESFTDTAPRQTDSMPNWELQTGTAGWARCWLWAASPSAADVMTGGEHTSDLFN